MVLDIPAGGFGDEGEEGEDYDWDEHLEDYDPEGALVFIFGMVEGEERKHTSSSPIHQELLARENSHS